MTPIFRIQSHTGVPGAGRRRSASLIQQARLGAHNLDPDFLLRDMHQGIVVERLPERRVVVRIALTGACVRNYWLVLERPEPSLCLVDPGMEVDLVVTADTFALHRVWVGELDLAKALTTGAIALDGPAELRGAFPGWLALGFFARRAATS